MASSDDIAINGVSANRSDPPMVEIRIGGESVTIDTREARLLAVQLVEIAAAVELDEVVEMIAVEHCSLSVRESKALMDALRTARDGYWISRSLALP
jgi:hypothetical protein